MTAELHLFDLIRSDSQASGYNFVFLCSAVLLALVAIYGFSLAR